MNVRTAVRRAAPSIAGLVAVYVLMVLTPLGRRLDEAAGFGRFLTGIWVDRFDHALLSSMSSAGALIVVGAAVLIASARGQWRRGARVAVAVVGSAASAEVLKLVLPSYRWYLDGWGWGGSYPSGHTAVATALALAVLSVCSQRWRRWLIGPAVGGVILTATATVSLNWHRPADVFGGLLLALAWHRFCGTGEPERRVRATLFGWGGTGAAIATLGVVGLAVRGALRGSEFRLPPWVPEPIDGGTGLVYVVSLALICVAATATVLGAGFPVSRPVTPEPERVEPVGSSLPA